MLADHTGNAATGTAAHAANPFLILHVDTTHSQQQQQQRAAPRCECDLRRVFHHCKACCCHILIATCTHKLRQDSEAAKCIVSSVPTQARLNNTSSIAAALTSPHSARCSSHGCAVDRARARTLEAYACKLTATRLHHTHVPNTAPTMLTIVCDSLHTTEIRATDTNPGFAQNAT